MYTDKERSIKLKELGFEGEYEWCWYKFVSMPELYESPCEKGFEREDNLSIPVLMSEHDYLIPAYLADTLFEWLREWRVRNNYTCNFRILHGSIEIWLPRTKGYMERNEDHSLLYHELPTLTNMLADAIIWILSQESQLK